MCIRDRLKVAITVSRRGSGLVMVGAFTFADSEKAEEFYEKAKEARESALVGFTGAVVTAANARGAVERLKLRHRGEFVTFSTTADGQEAHALLGTAAGFSETFFKAAAREGLGK